MIGVCDEAIKVFDCGCYGCKQLKIFSEEIHGVRNQPEPDDKPIGYSGVDIEKYQIGRLILINGECDFLQRETNYGRAFTLLVFTSDVCSSIQDDDIKQKVLTNKQNLGWGWMAAPAQQR